MPNTHSVAENISFAGKLIDYGWVKVFEHLEILDFIARNAIEINALIVQGRRGKGIGKAMLNDAKKIH